MTTRHQVLQRRIARELMELERTAETVDRHWRGATLAASDQDAYLNSVALSLHAWYAGLERLLEAIAVEYDGGLPQGEAWHAELLRQMAFDLTPTRPAVLTDDVVAMLEEYRKFRHLIRNIYAANLDPKRMGGLVHDLPALWLEVRAQIEAFSSFLAALSLDE